MISAPSTTIWANTPLPRAVTRAHLPSREDDGSEHDESRERAEQSGRNLYRERKRYAERQRFSGRSLAINEKAAGPDRSAIVMALSKPGLSPLQSKVDANKAEPLVKRGWHPAERRTAPYDPEATVMMNKLADVLHQTRVVMPRPAAAQAVDCRDRKGVRPDNP